MVNLVCDRATADTWVFFVVVRVDGFAHLLFEVWSRHFVWWLMNGGLKVDKLDGLKGAEVVASDGCRRRW